MYVCMYLYVFVCICIYLYVFVCICMYLYVFVCTCNVCICMCMYVHVYVCICMCMYVYVCVVAFAPPGAASTWAPYLFAPTFELGIPADQLICHSSCMTGDGSDFTLLQIQF